MRFCLKSVGIFILSGFLLTSLGAQSLAADDLSPVVPSLASFIIPGSGQLINEQPNKALTHFVVVVGIDTATYFLSLSYVRTSLLTYRLGSLLHLAWSSYSAYDAYQVASNKKQSIFNTSWNLNSAETTEPDFKLADSSAGISELNREFSVSAVG